MKPRECVESFWPIASPEGKSQEAHLKVLTFTGHSMYSSSVVIIRVLHTSEYVNIIYTSEIDLKRYVITGRYHVKILPNC